MLEVRTRNGWSFPLRVHLLVLVVGTLLPALALSAFLIQRVISGNRAAVERQLLEAARAGATIIDAELSGTIRGLQALAQSDRLINDDLQAFRDEAERVERTQPSWYDVVLQTSEGRAVLNVAGPHGRHVRSTIHSADVARIRQTREPLVGSLRGGSDLGEQPAFPVHVPVLRDGRVVYILSAVITPERLSALLGRQRPLPDEWVRGILDNAGVLVARSRDAERYVGQKGTAEFLRHVTESADGVYRDTSLDGQRVYTAYARAPMSGWTAGIAVSASVIDAAFRRSMIVLVAFGVTLLAVGFGGAYEISRRISRDIGGAARSAKAIAAGQHANLPHSPVWEVQQLSDALARSESLLDARLRERDEHVVQAEAARREAEAARVEAEAANKAKDQFLAMLGHELRNPLAPVLTALELMRLRADPGAQREREIIERQVKHLVRLVDDLLDVSRLRRGRVELRRRPFEIIRAIEKAVEIAGPLIAERGHHLTIDVSTAGLIVDGDETRLAQVFANLLTNAAKYSNRPGNIDLSAALEDGTVVVRCQDDGIGIAPELLPRVFDLFTQGSQTLDRRTGGLGLGLAVAKTLIELHGGTIEASSAGIGRGSAFVVRLPHVATTAVHARSERVAMPPVSQDIRVLVVDDNRDAANMVADTLRLGGFHVAMAFDGAEALDAMEQFQPNVAVLDIGLPSMDGLELARRLRAGDPSRSIRLIALTGYGQEMDVVASSAAGFDRHLVKPVEATTLFEAVTGTMMT